MKTQVIGFLWLLLGSFALYFGKCLLRKVPPELYSAARLAFASGSITVAGRVLVSVFTSSDPALGSFIDADFSRGVALFAGAMCGFWFGISTVLNVLAAVKKPTER